MKQKKRKAKPGGKLGPRCSQPANGPRSLAPKNSLPSSPSKTPVPKVYDGSAECLGRISVLDARRPACDDNNMMEGRRDGIQNYIVYHVVWAPRAGASVLKWAVLTGHPTWMGSKKKKKRKAMGRKGPRQAHSLFPCSPVWDQGTIQIRLVGVE